VPSAESTAIPASKACRTGKKKKDKRKKKGEKTRIIKRALISDQ
jgi:hypothetical protein